MADTLVGLLPVHLLPSKVLELFMIIRTGEGECEPYLTRTDDMTARAV